MFRKHASSPSQGGGPCEGEEACFPYMLNFLPRHRLSYLIAWLSVTAILSTIYCHKPWYNLFHVSSPFFIKTKTLYYIILFNNSTIIYSYKTINSDCTSFISYQLNSYLFVSSKLYGVLLCPNFHLLLSSFSVSLLSLLTLPRKNP